MQLEKDTTLQNGKYVILKNLGQGGFGITYLAEQVALARKVAIKEFFLKKICNRDSGTSRMTVPATDNASDVELFKRKFIKEARNLSKLDHPNIIRVYDCFEENDTVYYVMELVDGGSLNDFLDNKGGRIAENEALSCIEDIAKALEYLHSQSMNHLDVKPDNVLRRENGDLVLIDFGLTKTYDTSGSETSSTPVGRSPGYAPLEQYNPGGVSTFTPQTDVYSLGATLYKLLTGSTPPEASVVLNSGLPPMNAPVSAHVKAAIEAAMSPMCKNRPSSISEFMKLLKGENIQTSSQTEMATDDDDLSEETIMPTTSAPVSKPTPPTSPVQQPVTPPKPAIAPPSPFQSNNEKKKSTTPLIIGIVAAVVIAIIVIIAMGGSGNSQSDNGKIEAQASSGTAEIKKVNTEHGMLYEGEEGMLITVNFTTSNMKGQIGTCAALFYTADGSEVKNPVDNDYSSEGQLMTFEMFKVDNNSERFDDFGLFLPYSQFSLKSGSYDLQFQVILIDEQSNLLSSSEIVEFTYSNH